MMKSEFEVEGVARLGRRIQNKEYIMLKNGAYIIQQKHPRI